MKLISLVEQVSGKSIITESDRKKLPEGVLCRVRYPICNVGELNRNNRVYEQQVWDHVLNDNDLQQKLGSRSLLGHAEHPKDTSQSSTEKVSHVVNKIVDEHNGKIFTEVDVLDTPYGRICDTLLRAGCGLGMSTRAEGELEEFVREGKQAYRVVPEAYSLKTIDFTADPSTYGAYPESVERELVGQIKQGVDDSKIDQEYATVMLESMKLPEAKSLLESIKNDKHHKDCKCKASEKKCSGGCVRENEAKLAPDGTWKQMIQLYIDSGGSPDNAVKHTQKKFPSVDVKEMEAFAAKEYDAYNESKVTEAHKPNCDCGFCQKIKANKAKKAGKEGGKEPAVKEGEQAEVDKMFDSPSNISIEGPDEKGMYTVKDKEGKVVAKADKIIHASHMGPVKEGIPCIGDPVTDAAAEKSPVAYAGMTDEQLIGIAHDYEAAIDKGQLTMDMWKELEQVYNELKKRAKPTESIVAAYGRYMKRMNEMMPGLSPTYSAGLSIPPGMNEAGWKAEIDADLAKTKADPSHAEDVMVFLDRLYKKYPQDKEAIQKYVEVKSKEPTKESALAGRCRPDSISVNFEELLAKFQDMDAFSESETKALRESKTQVSLMEKVTKIVENLKRDLAIVKAERDTALELANENSAAMLEKYTKETAALSQQVVEASKAKEEGGKTFTMKLKEAAYEIDKKVKETATSVANKVATEMKKIYEDKISKLKAHYESELIRTKAECDETIFQKTVIDAKIKESGLKNLPENAVTLLRRCRSEAEVDGMIDQIRYALKEDFAHSGKPANISVGLGKDTNADTPLLNQTRLMVELLNPKVR